MTNHDHAYASRVTYDIGFRVWLMTGL